jgi:arylsulfatase A-like enzyme
MLWLILNVMKTNNYFPVVGALFALGLSIANCGQPNILFLLSDDQAWNGLSCAMHSEVSNSKNPHVQTPNLEKLASRGMRFSAAYSPASVCAPTRISLQTGKSPAQCHWTKAAGSVTAEDGFKLVPPRNRRSIESNEVTIGELLQSAGYATAHYGKWHIAGGGPENNGYDESDGNTGNEAAAPFVEPNPVDIFGMGERAQSFMEKNSKAGKPFFIQMSYHALHYPQNARKSLVEKYRKLIPNGNDKEIGRAAIAEDLDRGVGELLEKIDLLGISGNTYVIYMSDNGSSSKKVLRGGKGGVWEGGIRVPLIIRGPGIAANSWCHERVVGYDFFPTWCKMAGVKEALPSNIEGGLIDHLLAGKAEPVNRPREELVFHFPHYQGDAPHTAMFLNDYKLVRFYEDDSLHLYDTSDIAESNNLADRKPEVARAMVERMDNYLQLVKAQMPVRNPKFDPDNAPDLTKMRGGKGGNRGSGKKRAGGGKKNKKVEQEVSPAPTANKNPKPSAVSGPAVGGSVDTSPEAFEIAAFGGPPPTKPSTEDNWIKAHADELDINGDGKIATAELLSQGRVAFGAFDADGNGALSAPEYTGKTPKMAVAGFLTSRTVTIDANRDDIITAHEFANELKKVFSQSDTNKDGVVSGVER